MDQLPSEAVTDAGTDVCKTSPDGLRYEVSPMIESYDEGCCNSNGMMRISASGWHEIIECERNISFLVLPLRSRHIVLFLGTFVANEVLNLKTKLAGVHGKFAYIVEVAPDAQPTAEVIAAPNN